MAGPTHRPVDPRASFPELELEVLQRWRDREIFKQSIVRRQGAPQWGFYEGPPTANGDPGTHHVLSRVFKDIFPRYRTMTGHYVERKGGWDCHGLAVELAVEAELGMKSKEDIERYGIAEFNARCRQKVLSHVEEWNRLTERIGFWIDLDDAYRTLDPEYVESVWWALKTIHEKGLLYEKLKVVPYCPRCGTALSSHELGQPDVYQDVIDPSVYVRLPVTESTGAAQIGDELLVWTTTPWTLVSNAAVAVDPELTYVRAEAGGRVQILARALVERVLGEDAHVLDEFPGSALVGTRYEPPFAFIPSEAYGPKGHTVLPGDFVTAQDGTGLVHTAIAFGDDDFRLGEQQGLTVVNPVRPDGTYDERIGPYAGRNVKDADEDLIEDLRVRDRVLRAEPYEHSYPHCWRCGTPLLYYAKPSWYIATSQIKDRLLASNETVNWHPGHVKHGRFGNWLEGNVDWALSRERYWGTPLPVWRCPHSCTKVIGSLQELQELSGQQLTDPHRPFVDEITFPCENCGQDMRRVPEVIDVWFDSGSMPFAQFHAPHANLEHFEQRFPADFVCEALDQTRGWFYSLLAISTLLFDQSSYRNVVCLGLILDEQGRKMSKSRGNAVEPWDVIDRFGADALRWYFFTSKLPWDGYRFSLETIGEAVRQFLLQLWNTYAFYVLYANANSIDREPRADAALGPRPLDRVAWQRHGRDRPRADGGVRRDQRRPRNPGVRRRALELVCAANASRVLGRLMGRVRDAADVPAHGREAARSILSVRRRRDLRQPRRHRAERSPLRLPDRGTARPRTRAGDGDRARDGSPRARGAREGQAQRPQAAARRDHRRDGRRARVDRASGGDRARRAQRPRAAVRVAGRRAGSGRGQAQLPHPRPPVRAADADGGGRDRRPGRGPCGGGAARRPVAINLGRRP